MGTSSLDSGEVKRYRHWSSGQITSNFHCGETIGQEKVKKAFLESSPPHKKVPMGLG